MNSANDYVRRVMDRLPAGALRESIAMELRGNIADRIESGQSLEQALSQLGDPETLARSYLSAVPLIGATLGRRALAKLIDMTVVIFAVLPLMVVAGRTLPEELAAIVVLAGIVMASLGFGVYTIGAEFRLGQTLGKHALGLRVVRESGDRIGFGQAIVRQLPMFFQFYWVDILFALFTPQRQRAFELLSKTRVIDERAAGSAGGRA